MSLWGGRFSEGNSELFLQYTASIGFDQKLIQEDIQGSLAHVNMLSKCGIIPREDAVKIQKGLLQVLDLQAQGKIEFNTADEDVHLNVERKLHELIGPVAGKLHSARSRNDQVALDVQLYIRKAIAETATLLSNLIATLIKIAEENKETLLPGMTHLQHAQPVSLAHHLLAYAQMFSRDLSRFIQIFERANYCPLGAGALAGTGLPIDREHVAKLLKFKAPTANSMDTVCNRDSTIEFLFNAALCWTHLSRFNEELIIWTAPEFGYIDLPDSFCTGSSMMPQKKNPDLCELLRGKTGRAYGNLFSLMTTVKGLPLTYFKDLQEDKEPLFDTVENILPALILFNEMLSKTKFIKEKMAATLESDFSNVTDAADYLVTKGIPFREAHEICGKMVRFCIDNKLTVGTLSSEQLKSFSDKFGKDFYDFVSPANVMKRRKSFGGTSPEAVAKQINNLKTELTAQQSAIKNIFETALVSNQDLLIQA